MNDDKQQIVLFTDDSAAQIRTVTGWVSRTGRFWGDDERMARFDGATHRRCESHGSLYEINSYCKECWGEKQEEKFAAMPKEKWDGVAMLYCESNDKFFDDADSIRDHIEEMDCPPEEALSTMRLVICYPEYPKEIDPYDHFCDSLPEGSDPPASVIAAFDELNKALKECNEPLCWWPGKSAAIVTIDQIGIESASGESHDAT